MQEQLLADYFEGRVPAAVLGPALRAAQVVPEPVGFRASGNYRTEPLMRPFGVTPSHLVRLVADLASGSLSVPEVGIACFLMEANPADWYWDADTAEGERVANAVFWLGTPEVNYPLEPEVLTQIREYLLTGSNALKSRDTRQ